MFRSVLLVSGSLYRLYRMKEWGREKRGKEEAIRTDGQILLVGNDKHSFVNNLFIFNATIYLD